MQVRVSGVTAAEVRRIPLSEITGAKVDEDYGEDVIAYQRTWKQHNENKTQSRWYMTDRFSGIKPKSYADGAGERVPVDQVPEGWMALDSGVETSKEYVKALEGAKTVVWNGPMGVFEFDAFANGTLAVAQAVAKATEQGAISIVGGGDSVAALKKTGLTEKISHVSTGGGATLEFLEGKEMPGIAAIADK